MEGDRTLYEADMTIPTVIVTGNEGKEQFTARKEASDFLKLNGGMHPLGYAVLMYEALSTTC